MPNLRSRAGWAASRKAGSRWKEGGGRERGHRVRSNDAILIRISLDNLELNGTHATAHKEEVVLPHGSVGFHEVRLEENVKEVARNALNGVINGEDMDPLAVLDIGALVDGDDVAEAHL
jgi:hypothetical protein